MIAARSTGVYVTEDKRHFEGGDERVLDLVHLARQTDGDAALEAELLAMFDCQAAKLSLRLALPEVSSQAKADIAHRLRGSALAVGARQVAAAAEATEAYFTALAAGFVGEADPLHGLQAAIVEARAAIASLGG